ncbi:MAG: bifunctional diaminohydroxyphosphoribosylaminopyrimidine deaminase/5-amino-6-(5-phosphoribosylamino)uracil reductase RibD [Alphaproteobacteria bacterium]|nr:bifunctional diaminohydroxyphosphoribosylaminopyrimidine deaminase/5-amino-6-(5-phosphoribosylamino)uracil reductase RibD [Alphaproteobacteria bacterium]
MSDENFMELALRMGRRNMGATAENPSVGCVIVNGSQIVGRGVTAAGGRPHAETQALSQAGEAAKGSTVFVTLEPCAHYGNTPPCCDALIDSGADRVVIAVGDPDPRTAGEGIARMQTAGISVEQGACEAEGRADLAGYLSRVERDRPWVTLKMAVSSDGMMAAAPGVQTAITQGDALRRSQMMRAHSDAILVGVGTVRADDPMLTCRLPGLEHMSPARVIVGASAQSLVGTKLASTANDVPVWCLGADDGDGAISEIGCAIDADGKVNLAAAMAELAARGINRLLVEGGAKIAQSFLDADLVDQIVLFTAPHALGSGGVAAPLEWMNTTDYITDEPILLGVDEMKVYDRVQ